MGNRLDKIEIRFNVTTQTGNEIPALLSPIPIPLVVSLTPVNNFPFRSSYTEIMNLTRKSLETLSPNTRSSVMKITHVEYVKDMATPTFMNTLYYIRIQVHFHTVSALREFFVASRGVKTAWKNVAENKTKELLVNLGNAMSFVIEKNYDKTTQSLLIPVLPEADKKGSEGSSTGKILSSLSKIPGIQKGLNKGLSSLLSNVGD